MTRTLLACLLMMVLLAGMAVAGENGLVHVKSAHSVAVTADRLEDQLNEKGMKVFLKLDHAAGAAGVKVALRPTVLFIFGNPKVGAPLMQQQQQVGIDLPQKMLIWKDESDQVWLTYNDPDYLARRHNLKPDLPPLAKVQKALAGFARAAAAP